MVEEAVLRADEKIGNAITIEVACAWASGVSSQFFVGKIALPRKAPATVFGSHLPPKDDVVRVHDEVWFAVAVPIGETELAASA